MVGMTGSDRAARLAANTRRSGFKLSGRDIRILAILFCCLFWAGVILMIAHAMS
jgi:hypothetical protein